MKALSLTQPWATLVVNGSKHIETRSWPTNFRGPIAVHAAKGFPRWAKDTALDWPFRDAIKSAGYLGPSGLPLGAIIGTVEIVDCRRTDDLLAAGIEEVEEEFGDYGSGRFGFLLRKPVKFLEPIICPGALGLWEVPQRIAERIKAEPHEV